MLSASHLSQCYELHRTFLIDQANRIPQYEDQSHDAKSKKLDVIDSTAQAMPLVSLHGLVRDTNTLDTSLAKYHEVQKDLTIVLTLFDITLLMEARGANFEALDLKKKIIQALGYRMSYKEPRLLRLVGYFIRNHCALGQWENAEQELTGLLCQLKFIAAEIFPMMNSSLLSTANAFDVHSKWLQAESIYGHINDHAIWFRGPDSYYFINALRLLVDLFELQSSYAEAWNMQSRLLATYKRAYGPHAVDTQYSMLKLA